MSLSFNQIFAFSFQFVLFKLRGLGCGIHLCVTSQFIAFDFINDFIRSSVYRPMEMIIFGDNKFIAAAVDSKHAVCS